MKDADVHGPQLQGTEIYFYQNQNYLVYHIYIYMYIHVLDKFKSKNAASLSDEFD